MFRDKKWFFLNGIVFPFQFENTSIKNKIHEYFHFLSANTIIENIDGKYYDKVGLHYTVYDEADNVVDKTFSCEFLNEGITEFLASKITNTKPNIYELNVMVIELLTMNNHNEIIEAYFSEEHKKIIEYKYQFEQNSGYNFEIFFDNNMYGVNISQHRVEEIIISCIMFQINSTLSREDLEQVEKQIRDILYKYSNNPNLVYNSSNIINIIQDAIYIKRKNLLTNRNKGD